MNAVVENLLPTPAASRSGRNRSASDGAAIRWSLDSMHHLLADTTQPSDDGNNTTEPPRTLWPADDSTPVSSEWMMGYPAGWVTGQMLVDADPRPDRLSRTQALKALGNAVVPQVAELAWRELAA